VRRKHEKHEDNNKNDPSNEEDEDNSCVHEQHAIENRENTVEDIRLQAN
jgi:hypothetical protein